MHDMDLFRSVYQVIDPVNLSTEKLVVEIAGTDYHAHSTIHSRHWGYLSVLLPKNPLTSNMLENLLQARISTTTNWSAATIAMLVEQVRENWCAVHDDFVYISFKARPAGTAGTSR